MTTKKTTVTKAAAAGETLKARNEITGNSKWNISGKASAKAKTKAATASKGKAKAAPKGKTKAKAISKGKTKAKTAAKGKASSKEKGGGKKGKGKSKGESLNLFIPSVNAAAQIGLNSGVNLNMFSSRLESNTMNSVQLVPLFTVMPADL